MPKLKLPFSYKSDSMVTTIKAKLLDIIQRFLGQYNIQLQHCLYILVHTLDISCLKRIEQTNITVKCVTWINIYHENTDLKRYALPIASREQQLNKAVVHDEKILCHLLHQVWLDEKSLLKGDKYGLNFAVIHRI